MLHADGSHCGPAFPLKLKINNTPNRDELVLILEGMLALLTEKDYHPGLAGWQVAYSEQLRKLLNFLEV